MIPVARYFEGLGRNRAKARSGAVAEASTAAREARALPEFEPLAPLDERIPRERPLSRAECFVLGACAGALGISTGMLILIVRVYLPLIHH